MDGAESKAAPHREPGFDSSDDYTVRVSRRTVRRVVVTALVVLALVGGIAIGVAVGGSDDDQPAATRNDTTAGSTTTTSARTTTSTAAPGTSTATLPPATTVPSAPAEAAAAAPDSPAAPAAPPAPPAPTATASVTLALGRACEGAALTTSVTVEWHGTLGESYFLQVNQSNGLPLMHQGVGSDGTQTFPNVACGLLPVHARFATNTATGSVNASADA